MNEIINFWNKHWLVIIMVPGNALAIEAIIREAAVEHGYTKIVSVCDHLANVLGFVIDIISGLLKRGQTKQGGTNA